MHPKFDLSIIILSYNVKDLLLNCLNSIYKNASDVSYQVIVVDNASSDNSLEEAKKKFPKIESYQTGSNLGFAKGNNYAIPYVKSDTVLFLNPDTLVVKDVLQKTYKFFNQTENIGAVTCRVEFENGNLDYSSHRGFPTPWNSLSYFLGLSKIYPKSKIFSSYPATHLDTSKTHKIDCGSGTFLMVKKSVGDKIGWWDSDYFWNGEDIEFFYRLKELGLDNYYFAEGKIIHFKGSSSGLQSTAKSEVPVEKKIWIAKHAAQAMRIFYLKHYYPKYPIIIRELILAGITTLEYMRLFKIKKGLKYD